LCIFTTRRHVEYNKLDYRNTAENSAVQFCLFLAHQPPVGQGLLINAVSISHTTTHHSPLPDNTRHSQLTNILATVGFEPTISAGERPQTYALDRAATATGAVPFAITHLTLLGMIAHVLIN